MMIPEYVDIQTWASSLVIDFPTDDIPILRDEEEWKSWGDILSQCESFIKNNIPNTKSYDDWKSWAQSVFLCMNNT